MHIEEQQLNEGPRLQSILYTNQKRRKRNRRSRRVLMLLFPPPTGGCSEKVQMRSDFYLKTSIVTPEKDNTTPTIIYYAK